jgi:hypothetical protein
LPPWPSLLEPGDVARDHLGLLVTPLPAEAGSLHHAKHEQIIALGMHAVEKQMRRIALPVQKFLSMNG